LQQSVKLFHNNNGWEALGMNPVRHGTAEEFQLRLHCVRQTPDKGRGVFALTNILKNSLILESHAVVLSAGDCEKIDETSIWIYRFALGDECAMVFGDIAFCNHSDTPNAEVVWNRLDSTAAIASLAAVTDIAANAEIVIDYTDIQDYVRRGVVFS
jgi:SET domain-containing protein